MAANVRLLVVEDFEPFRRQVCAVLESRANFTLVGEVADGLEAVRQAAELQPDLVLLDVGLPLLNGIDAAREIRVVAPSARLLFMSLDCSTPMVREMLRLGAHGYVDKMHAAADLLPAIETVLKGGQFVSRSVALSESSGSSPRHEVQFCSDERVLLERSIRLVSAALQAGHAAIGMLTRPHLDILASRLRQEVDLDEAIRRGAYMEVDAMESATDFMRRGVPERAELIHGFERLVDWPRKAATAANPRVVIVGEWSGILYAAGYKEAAVHLEELGHEVVHRCNVDILCLYSDQCFGSPEDARAFELICAAHSAAHSC
jgi:DNA-binding NarL/FixJ family response regulator